MSHGACPLSRHPNGRWPRTASAAAAHNRHERLVKQEKSVLRFIQDPNGSFTNNTANGKSGWQKSNERSLDAFERQNLPKRIAASPATGVPWVLSATIPSSLLRLLSKETPPIGSTKIAMNQIPQIEG
ncbi:MAG: hypothetical protein OXC63_13755 [Aestuariivita sp.]|nr:hypothetical protein [Aestuariivita sp.]MCY4347202.1 hypothetical protein [Aestuariivita sp.]